MPIVVLTGASRGIGLHLGRELRHKGWEVVGIVRTNSGDPAMADSCDRQVECDLSDVSMIDRAINPDIFPSVDLLVNCAGVLGYSSMSFGDFSIQSFEHVLKVNLVAPALIIRNLVPSIMSSPVKKIVNISAWNGSISHNTGGLLSYRCAKAALNQLTKSAAIEFKNLGITVVAVNPGWVKTDMGGKDAPIDPAACAISLVQFIERVSTEDTGKFLEVDGTQIAY